MDAPIRLAVLPPERSPRPGSGAVRALHCVRDGCSPCRPTRHVARPLPFPGLHPCPGRHRDFRLGGRMDTGQLMAPAARTGPLRASPSAHVCAPGRWIGRAECEGVRRGGDKFHADGALSVPSGDRQPQSLHRGQSMIDMNSCRVTALSRNTPSMRLVTRSVPGFMMPRAVMQKCSALSTTPTP